MTERELKQLIFDRYPDLANVRALAWSGGREVPTNPIIGVAVVPRIRFDGWYHLPIRDVELRGAAWAFLDDHPNGGRWNCKDDDAILVLAVIQ